MTLVYDIGMYDGADTAYYLERGFRVVAVEANPTFVARGRSVFASAIAAGRLEIVHAAISPDGQPVTLNISAQDPGSSSIDARWIGDHEVTPVPVAGARLTDLIARYGIPDFLKVDIEGSDRLCVLAITAPQRPRFLSFELATDAEELIRHCATVGFTRFRFVSQQTFRELATVGGWRERVALRLLRLSRFAEPRKIERNGRHFVIGSSSGPAPWELEGPWFDADSTLGRLTDAQARSGAAGWFDVHASA